MHPQQPPLRSWRMKSAPTTNVRQSRSGQGLRKSDDMDAYVVSPIANLSTLSANGIEVVQHQALISSMQNEVRCGTAKLCRRGSSLRVSVASDRPFRICLLQMLSGPSEMRGGSGRGNEDANLLLACYADGPEAAGTISHAAFDLSDRTSFPLLSAAAHRKFPQHLLEGLRAAAVVGLAFDKPLPDATRPRRGAENPTSLFFPDEVPESSIADVLACAKTLADRRYFRRRMDQEIIAALAAERADVASRHVGLATLLARNLISSTSLVRPPIR